MEILVSLPSRFINPLAVSLMSLQEYGNKILLPAPGQPLQYPQLQQSTNSSCLHRRQDLHSDTLRLSSSSPLQTSKHRAVHKVQQSYTQHLPIEASIAPTHSPCSVNTLGKDQQAQHDSH